MNNDQPEILQNVVLLGTLISWATAVLLKGALALVRTGTLTASDFFGPGGMPSTHTAPVLTCTVLIGYVSGWDTPLFALACTFASVVMYDASGVRRAAGKHAQAINLIFKGLFEQGHFQNQKLE
ncbi:MAG TPA: divergent PAP2 family protein, partial [bacterium]|nr:divergent PAP2 family protein [bacterium]